MENINKIKNKIQDLFVNNIRWISLFLSFMCFLFIAEDVMDKEIMSFDSNCYNIISKYLINDTMTKIAKLITIFGGTYFLIICAIVLVITIKNNRIKICIALNLPLAALINYTVKQIVQRPRPEEYRIINESGYSFPSGHSMVSMAFYGLLIYWIIKNVKNKYYKCTLVILLGMLILLIGTSRIYLGVHYTSDVIAGFLIAFSYLIIFISVLESNNKEIDN